MIRIFCTFVFLIVSASAHAADGNDLQRWCTSHDTTVRAAMLGYILGATDGLMMPTGAGDGVVCMDPKVQPTQIRDVVCQFVDANPATRHLSGGEQVWFALTKAFT